MARPNRSITKGHPALPCTRCRQLLEVQFFRIDRFKRALKWCIPCREGRGPDQDDAIARNLKALVALKSEPTEPPKGVLPPAPPAPPRPACIALGALFECAHYRAKISYATCLARRQVRVKQRDFDGRPRGMPKPVFSYCAVECNHGRQNAELLGQADLIVIRSADAFPAKRHGGI